MIIIGVVKCNCGDDIIFGLKMMKIRLILNIMLDVLKHVLKKYKKHKKVLKHVFCHPYDSMVFILFDD